MLLSGVYTAFQCVRGWSDDEYRAAYAAMDKTRRVRCDALRSSHARKLCAAADMLARKAFHNVCGLRPEKVIFSHTPQGKPYVEDCPFHLSLSHSGDYAVCALACAPVGIDIEKIRVVSPHIARRFCTSAELEYIDGNPVRLLNVWTLKEAYGKALGAGVAKSMRSVSFDIKERHIRKNPDVTELIPSSDPFYVFSLDHFTIEGYILALCIKTG